MTTSIEESDASKQQEQSSIPMSGPSKEFIPIDQRKWNDIPAIDNVKGESLAQKISKKVTVAGEMGSPRHAVNRWPEPTHCARPASQH